MKKVREPVGEARDDYAIFQAIARRMGVGEVHSDGREIGEWLSHLYEEARVKSAKAGVSLPPFEEFWEAGIAEATGTQEPPVMLGRVSRRSRGAPAQDAIGQDRDLLRAHRLVRL